MKLGIIDIGSNSVRLMLWADGKTLYKQIKTTRLGEGLNFKPYLKREACERTAQAVADFVALARGEGAQGVYAFATAAVRSSENREMFLEAVKQKCGVCVDVIDGETEAEIGLLGALRGADGGIIDVGGASTEVTVKKHGKIVYTKSVNIGTVRILDAAGRDLNKIYDFIGSKIGEYEKLDFSDIEFYAVGGTASRLGAIKNGLKQYDSGIINGTGFTLREIKALAKELTDKSVDEIMTDTICGSSADLVGGGAALLASVMENFSITKIKVSESDNLEGYLKYKLYSAKG